LCTCNTRKKLFKEIADVPSIRKQHHIKVFHKDVIEYALYATRKESYVFRFWNFFVDYIFSKEVVLLFYRSCLKSLYWFFILDNICVFTSINYQYVLSRNEYDEISAFLKRYSVTKNVIPSRQMFLPVSRSYYIFWVSFFCIYSSSSKLEVSYRKVFHHTYSWAEVFNSSYNTQTRGPFLVIPSRAYISIIKMWKKDEIQWNFYGM
jgi:hypothetical protein